MALCTIFGNILDSGLTPLEGILVIKLDSAIVNFAGDSIETYEAIFPIVAGIINIDLESSETQKVTYSFKFFRTIAGSEPVAYESQALPDFHSIVPNLASYPWDQLRLQTGITTASMSTAALAVGKEMLENPTLAQIIYDSLGFFKTVNTPLNPVANTQWLFPDTFDHLTFKVSENEFFSSLQSVQISASDVTANIDEEKAFRFIAGFSKVLIKNVFISLTQGNPVNVSDFHTIQIGYLPPNTSTPINLVSFNTTTFAQNVREFRTFETNLNLNYDDINRLTVRTIKTNTPGDIIYLDVNFGIQYRN